MRGLYFPAVVLPQFFHFGHHGSMFRPSDLHECDSRSAARRVLSAPPRPEQDCQNDRPNDAPTDPRDVGEPLAIRGSSYGWPLVQCPASQSSVLGRLALITMAPAVSGQSSSICPVRLASGSRKFQKPTSATAVVRPSQNLSECGLYTSLPV